jgi:hypothetical protein
MCCTGGFNLSYESLTGYEARQKLRDLKTTDPDFWNGLTQKTTTDAADMADENMSEDEDSGEVPFEDDSDLPCETIIARVLGSDIGAGVISWLHARWQLDVCHGGRIIGQRQDRGVHGRRECDSMYQSTRFRPR